MTSNSTMSLAKARKFAAHALSTTRTPTIPARIAHAIVESNVVRDLTDVRALRFTLAPSNAQLVTVTEKVGGIRKVVMANNVSVDTEPKPNGSLFEVDLEIRGNPTDTATIAVMNGNPSLLTITIPAGLTSSKESRIVEAKW